MSDEPVMARKGPYGVVVEKGKSYWWCSCGRSKTQPFCDGSHQGTGFEPIEYVAKENGLAAFCGCKRSSRKPACDDTHISIELDEEGKPV